MYIIKRASRYFSLFDVSGQTATYRSKYIRVMDGQRLYIVGAVYAITGGATVSTYYYPIRSSEVIGAYFVLNSGTTTYYYQKEWLVPPPIIMIEVYLSGGTSPTYAAYCDVAIYD